MLLWIILGLFLVLGLLLVVYAYLYAKECEYRNAIETRLETWTDNIEG